MCLTCLTRFTSDAVYRRPKDNLTSPWHGSGAVRSVSNHASAALRLIPQGVFENGKIYIYPADKSLVHGFAHCGRYGVLVLERSSRNPLRVIYFNGGDSQNMTIVTRLQADELRADDESAIQLQMRFALPEFNAARFQHRDEDVQ